MLLQRVVVFSLPCPSEKDEENMPILETFDVPLHKRNKLLGPAWINVKKLFLETGVQVSGFEHMAG